MTRNAAETESILIDAKEAARMCDLGISTWYNLLASGKAPKPVRLGRSVKWRRDELRAWIGAGCPARSTWDSMKEKLRL
jgi:predicted DNA-binding transcriptional regulator AlpA